MCVDVFCLVSCSPHVRRLKIIILVVAAATAVAVVLVNLEK